MKKVLATMLIIVMVFSLLPTSIVFATNGKKTVFVEETLKPGSTLDVTTIPTYYYLSTAAEELYKYNINSEGTYTLKGWDPTKTRQVRFVVNKSCTIVLNGMGICVGVENADGTLNPYYGPTNGLFEIASGINVNFVLYGSNNISTWNLYAKNMKLNSILIGDNSTVTFSGSGLLQCYNVAKTVNSNGSGTANVVLNGGGLSVQGMGNIWRLPSNGSYVHKYSKASNLKLTTNGYYFYNAADYDQNVESYHNNMKTTQRATGDVYGVKIGVSNEDIKVKVGNGEFENVAVPDYNEKNYYYYHDGSSSKANICVVDGNSYKYYIVENKTNAVETYVKGTAKLGNEVISGGTVTFKGSYVTKSVTTGSDGSYKVELPNDTYTVEIALPKGGKQELGSVTTSGKETVYDIGIAVITGVVTSDGEALAGAVVFFEKDGAYYTTIADNNGQYELLVTERMKSSDGTVSISATKLLYTTNTKSVKYAPEMSVDFVIEKNESDTNAKYTEDKYDLDGDGEFDGVFEISNAEQLKWFATYVNISGAKERINAVLTNDIDLTGYEWTPIGVAGSDYVGIFDGQGHSVTNMTVSTKKNGLGTEASLDYQGFFGVMRYNSEVRNLNIGGSITVTTGDINYIGGAVGLAYENSKVSNVNSTVDIKDNGAYSNIRHVGGVVGKIGNSYMGETAGFVDNCSYNGTIKFDTASAVGGIVGYATNSSRIENCVSYGNVGDNYIGHLGGIVGSLYNGAEVHKCVNKATVKSTSHDCIGGIAGYATKNCFITNCINLGEISGIRPESATKDTSSYVGGVLGYINDSSFKGITNCLNIGKIVGGQTDAYTGAIIGWARSGADATTVKNTYYLEESASKAFGSGGNSGGVKSVTKQKMASGEIAYLLQNGQSDTVWGQTIGTEEHPVLGGNRVYHGTYCSGKISYKNNAADFEHDFADDGICTKCGAKNMTLTNDKYDLDGDGEKDACYEIGDLSEWKYFTSLVNTTAGGEKINAVLTANLDMTGYEYIPVGTTDRAYSGIFDGMGYEIVGMKLNPWMNNQGLFGNVSGAVIKNFTLKGNIEITESGLETVGAVVGWAQSESVIGNVKSFVNLTDNGKVGHVLRMGGIVASAQEGSIVENCEYGGNVTLAYGSTLGGIVGNVLSGTDEKPVIIRNCTTNSEMNFVTSRRIGGILGLAEHVALIEKCVSNANITITESDRINQAGGILGCTVGNTTINYCINTGNITDGKINSSLGGIVGMVDAENFGGITNCYSVGEIKTTHADGSEYWGEFVGCLKPESIKDKVKNNYYLSFNENCPAFGTIAFAGEATKMSAEQFKSGEVCYLLNGDQSEIVFHQTIGKDDYPKFSGKAVSFADGKYYNGISIIFDGTEKVTDGTTALGNENSDGTYSLPEDVVGYYFNGELVNAGEYETKDGDVITTAKFNTKMVLGAQVRYGGGLDEEKKIGKGNGLRFIATVDRSDFDGEGYGMRITAEGSDKELIINADKWQDENTYSVAITDMNVGNYNRRFTATPFVTVKYADERTAVIYGSESVTRSIYQVATGLLQTGGTDKEYTLEENAKLYDVLNAYVNMVGVRLTLSADGMVSASDKYTGEVFFDVTSQENADESYTITVTPITEGFKYSVNIADYWTEFVRINNNNSVVKNCISEVEENEDGGITFKFTLPQG